MLFRQDRACLGGSWDRVECSSDRIGPFLAALGTELSAFGAEVARRRRPGRLRGRFLEACWLPKRYAFYMCWLPRYRVVCMFVGGFSVRRSCCLKDFRAARANGAQRSQTSHIANKPRTARTHSAQHVQAAHRAHKRRAARANTALRAQRTHNAHK